MALPAMERPQVCSLPALISARRRPPLTAVGSGRLGAVVPSPSRPLPLLPQHQAAPSAARAQVCAVAATTALKVVVPATATGTRLWVTAVAPPSWPLPPLPQQ